MVVNGFFRYAFSLEETDARDAAETACLQSIKIQARNPWGIHTLSKHYRNPWDKYCGSIIILEPLLF